MSYVDRMCWRMLGPALVPLALGGVAAWLLSRLLDLPRRFVGQAVFPDLPFQTVMVGAVAAGAGEGWGIAGAAACAATRSCMARTGH